MMQREVKQLSPGNIHYKNIDLNPGSLTTGLFITAPILLSPPKTGGKRNTTVICLSTVSAGMLNTSYFREHLRQSPGSDGLERKLVRTSLVIQWLRVHLLYKARDMGPIPALERLHVLQGN